MTTQKTASAKPPAAPAEPTAAPATADRKPWIRKTPVEIVLEQIGKQEKTVAGMRAELAREERELAKLQKAKAVLEA